MNIHSLFSVDYAVTVFNATLSQLLDRHCPVIRRKVKLKHSGLNWFDSDLRHMRAKRRAAERQERKLPSAENRMKYIKICRTFNKLVWVKKKTFYQKSLQSSQNDKRLLFKKINKLMGKDEPELPRCNEDIVLANGFKEFFSSKIINIRATIEREEALVDTVLCNYEDEKPDCRFNHFSALPEEDIIKVIKSMPDKFCGLDPIPTWLLKE